MTELSCPACSRPLRRLTMHQTEVDECPRCGGIWFDAHELDTVTTSHHEQLAVQEADFSEETQLCPRDGNALLATSFLETSALTCPACRGFWLDGLSVDALVGLVAAEAAPRDVTCAGCGAVVPHHTTITRMDAVWCEDCVVRGDYPGGTGKTLAAMRAEMGQAMLKEVRNREQIKDNTELFDQLNVQVRNPYFNGGWQTRVDLIGWILRRFNR